MPNINRAQRTINPVHAVLLASTLPLFLGALLSDWAYASTYEVQWINFASWLIAGALVFAASALAWAAIEFFRSDRVRHRFSALYLLVLITTFVLGVLNALIHGKDGWATMPEGLILSVLVFPLAVAAVWLGFSAGGLGERR